MKHAVIPTLLLGLSLAGLAPLALADEVPTPESVLGHKPGDDYYLANYEESLAYFHQLADATPYMVMVHAGTSSEGRPMEYVLISTPENLANWAHIKQVSHQLADSRGLSEAQAHALAHDAKIIVHLDGGMHSSEAATHQSAIALAYKLIADKDDPKIHQILENEVIELWPTLNPDGQSAIANWYRQNVGGPNETAPLPWLYQKYVGHDNNRDGYMLDMPESQVVTRVEEENSPAIFYAQHQSAPFPARIWVPPFSDPISANVSPLMRQWTGLIGMHMMADFEQQELPGAIAQAEFDNWYPGFLDYTHVFRHTIAYFTETALFAYATPWKYDPEKFPEDRRDLKPQIMYPSPWKGGWWHLSDAVKYMMVGYLSTLDTALQYRETLMYNRYLSARDTIRRFQSEGPYAWVIPADQHDLPTAALLAQKMAMQDIELYTAPHDLTLGKTRVKAGAWVIPMNQPFAGLVQELFESQKYPDAFLNADGEPQNLPYDVTGWTLPMQMGVASVAVTDPISDPQLRALRRLDQVTLPVGRVHGSGNAGYRLPQAENVSFKALNAALATGASAGLTGDGGIILSGLDADRMASIVRDTGVQATAEHRLPETTPIAAARVGLYRPWKPSIDEGWTRWILEQYQFPLTSLYNADMKAGNLKDKVDVLIIPDIDLGWLMEGFDEKYPGEDDDEGGAKTDPVPAKYAGGIGGAGAQALRDFVAAGGTLVALNNGANAVIDVLGLPVSNVLAGLPSDQFFCSGALVQIELSDDHAPVTGGLARKPIVMFASGPAFEPKPGFEGHILARYAADENPLRSGVLLHPEAIESRAAAMEVDYGKGHVYLYGFRPQWRGQSLGAYKFLFNPLYKTS